MTDVAIDGRIDLEDTDAVDEFIMDRSTQESVLETLAGAHSMDEKQIHDFFYNPVVSGEVGNIGKAPEAHRVAIGLLREEVARAAAKSTDVVIIDGRGMEKYARQFEAQDLGQFVLGWHLTCDSAIAGERSVGMFRDHVALSEADESDLYREIRKIRDSNRSDVLREVDPMRQAPDSYVLDLMNFTPNGHGSIDGIAERITDGTRMAAVNTTYTRDPKQMWVPIVSISMDALGYAQPAA
jgi:hypothetical protein